VTCPSARNETTLKTIHKQNIKSTNFNTITVTFIAPFVKTPIIILHPKKRGDKSFWTSKKYLKKKEVGLTECVSQVTSQRFTTTCRISFQNWGKWIF